MEYKNTIWMHPNQVYVTSGGACANTLFFEDKHCHSLFFTYLNRFVRPMVDIIHYKLNATEWALLIRTKSEKEIRTAYFAQREKSDKANREIDHLDVSRMLSEHFRMFLSNFAKSCNAHRKRKGTVVMKRFDKFPITTEKDYYREFDKICDLKFCNYQQVMEKYQPDIKDYDKEGLVSDYDECPHELRNAVGVYRGALKVEKLPVSLIVVRPNSHLLRKILFNRKSKPNSHFRPPKLE